MATTKILDTTVCPSTMDVGALINGWIGQEKRDAADDGRAPLLIVKADVGTYFLDTGIASIDCALVIEGYGVDDGPGDNDLHRAGAYFEPRGLSFLDAGFYFSGQAARGSRLYRIAYCDKRAILPGTVVRTGWVQAAILILNCDGEVEIDQVFMPVVKRGVTAIGSGRVKIGKLWGCFLDNVLTIDDASDVVYAHSIHDWPFISTDTKILDYMKANKFSIILGGVDGFMCDNLFSIHCNTVVQINRITAERPASKIQFTNFYADFCYQALAIYESNRDGFSATYNLGTHVQFANFTSHHFDRTGAHIPNSRAVWIDADRAVVQIGNSRVDGAMMEEFGISWARSNSHIHVGSHMVWDPQAANRSTFLASTGSSVDFAMPPIVFPH